MKRLSSYSIALSGVSCALAILSVTAGAYLPTAKIALYALSAFCVAIPLTQNLVGGAIFTYIGAAILTGIICNIKCIPFVLFCGPYALIAWALDFKFYKIVKWPKTLKIFLIIVVKTAFFAAAFFACVALMKIVVSDVGIFGMQWTMPLFALFGWIAFSLFDVLYRVIYGQMTRFVSHYLSKTRRRGNKKDRPLQSKREKKDDLPSALPDDRAHTNAGDSSTERKEDDRLQTGETPESLPAPHREDSDDFFG